MPKSTHNTSANLLNESPLYKATENMASLQKIQRKASGEVYRIEQKWTKYL